MALIKCKNCGNYISDKSLTCPKCDTPNTPDEQLTQDILQEEIPEERSEEEYSTKIDSDEQPKKSRGKLYLLLVILLAAFVGVGIWSYNSYTAHKQRMIAEAETKAQLHIDSLYNAGLKAKDQEKYEEAVRCFIEAAEANHAGAQYWLGMSYSLGKGVEEDNEKAIEWLSRSVDNGIEDGLMYLGILLCQEGKTQNVPKGINYLEKAADAGNAEAAYLVGDSYEYGLNGKLNKNNQKAIDYYTKAAENKEIRAIKALGHAYYSGSLGQKNLQKGAQYFKLGAEEGDPECQYNYGYCLIAGEGVTQNIEEGFAFMQKAADQGFQEAIDRLEAARIDVLVSSKGEFDVDDLKRMAYSKGYEDGYSGYSGWNALESFDSWFDFTVGLPHNDEQRDSRRKYRQEILDEYIRGLKDS